MYGLSENQIALIKQTFGNYPVIDKVILYGSRAIGSYRDGSDIDLTLMGNSIDLTLLNRVENSLDDLLLPYRIDLSIFHTLTNPDLIEHIERVGKVIYDKNEQNN